MNPAEKHLAIRTEDHPLEYAEFEGVIPKGRYGAGTVMVWDTGTYDPMDDNIPLEQQLARGKIDFELHGVKLRGGFTLARTGKSSIDANGRERWLLIKQRDEYADPSWDIENPRFDARYLETMRLLGLPITPYIGESTVRDVIASQKGFMCLIRRIFFLSLFMISKPRSCQPRTMPPG
jgi:hypothetical protein